MNSAKTRVPTRFLIKRRETAGNALSRSQESGIFPQQRKTGGTESRHKEDKPESLMHHKHG